MKQIMAIKLLLDPKNISIYPQKWRKLENLIEICTIFQSNVIFNGKIFWKNLNGRSKGVSVNEKIKRLLDCGLSWTLASFNFRLFFWIWISPFLVNAPSSLNFFIKEIIYFSLGFPFKETKIKESIWRDTFKKRKNIIYLDLNG